MGHQVMENRSTWDVEPHYFQDHDKDKMRLMFCDVKMLFFCGYSRFILPHSDDSPIAVFSCGQTKQIHLLFQFRKSAIDAYNHFVECFGNFSLVLVAFVKSVIESFLH